MQNEVVAYLTQFIGIPYIYGGNNPVQGFDCSGLICEGLKFAGLIKNHEDFGAHQLYLRYRDLPEEKFPFRPGALVFFGTKAKVVHVGMISGDARMIEAGGGNENTRSPEVAAGRNAFVKERPVLYRSDFVGCYMPPYSTNRIP